jgi:hypothetical protein
MQGGLGINQFAFIKAFYTSGIGLTWSVENLAGFSTIPVQLFPESPGYDLYGQCHLTIAPIFEKSDQLLITAGQHEDSTIGFV